MFDVGLSELLLIALVALVVIGPERLPRVARMAGHLLSRFQRYVNDVKADINREMDLHDLKSVHKDIADSVRDVETSIRQGFNSAELEVRNSIMPPAMEQALADEKTATEEAAHTEAKTETQVEMQAGVQKEAHTEPNKESPKEQPKEAHTEPPATISTQSVPPPQLDLGFDSPTEPKKPS